MCQERDQSKYFNTIFYSSWLEFKQELNYIKAQFKIFKSKLEKEGITVSNADDLVNELRVLVKEIYQSDAIRYILFPRLTYSLLWSISEISWVYQKVFITHSLFSISNCFHFHEWVDHISFFIKTINLNFTDNDKRKYYLHI